MKCTLSTLFLLLPFYWFSQQITFTTVDSLNFEFRTPLKGFENYDIFEFEKSVNNNCASAITLTPGAACLSANTVGDNTQVGEVAPPCTGFGGGGVTDRTSWFRFTATSTSMVVDYNSLIPTNCATALAVYGPFAAGAGCLPTALQSVYCENAIAAGDPGDHNLLTGLVVGQQYLIQILNKDCGGSNSGTASFCIGVSIPATNNTVNAAAVINACGTVFNGNNAAGYYPSGSGTGLANLDGNAGTTCGTCGTLGNDVPYVINNDSWFNFCSANAGQWQVNFTVGTCLFSAPNNGLQMSIFTGTSGNLVNFQNAPSPSAPGSSFNSSVLTLSAGQCAYLMVDGFAGDQCTYSYTLTNITGGCVLLPVELISFDVQRFEKQAYMKWVVETERNNDYFTIERSINGLDWESISTVPSIGDHTFRTTYNFLDNTEAVNGSPILYYRLSQTDYNGTSEVVSITAVNGRGQLMDGFLMNVVPNPVVNESISLSIESAYDTFGTFHIKDAQGKEIYMKRASLVKGANIVSLENSELIPGVYYVEFLNQETLEIVKFIKL